MVLKFFRELKERNVYRAAAAYVVVSWFIVETAFKLEAVLNLPSWFDSAIAAIVIIGFPLVVIMSWAFELTPDGFKRTADVKDGDSISEKTGKKLDLAIIGGLVLVGGLIVSDRFIMPEKVQVASLSNVNSVAVLPFSNRSVEESDAYFADAIHDELLTQLSKISSMEVISRTSVMGYRNPDKRIPEIAEELGVAVILEGSVQRSGKRVRITATLIDGKADTQLWSDAYDREMTPDNIFEIQAEITRVIATSLEALIGNEEGVELDAKPTQNLASYEAYLQGKLLGIPNGNNEDNLRAAIDFYAKAIELDPEFSKPYAGKAYAQMSLYWFHTKDKSMCDAAINNLEKAQGLTPDDLDTLLAGAFYQYWCLDNFARANDVFDRALNVAPNNVDALAGKAFIQRRLGKFKLAAEDLAKAHRLDPKTFYLIPELAFSYVLAGDFEQANQMLAKSRLEDPESIAGAIFEAAVMQFQGKRQEAYDAMARTGNILPKDVANYAISTKNRETIENALTNWPMSARWPEDSPELYNLAQLKAMEALGDTEEYNQAIEELRVRVSKQTTLPKWGGPSKYSPVVIPGFLGDLDRVEALAQSYENSFSKDAMSAISAYSDMAEAFARAGAPDRAMDHLDIVRANTGPYIYAVYSGQQSLESLRDFPRFIEFKAEYEAWFAAQKSG